MFTVDARSPQIDLNLAPVEVFRVLPGFTPEVADALIARRTEALFRTPADIASFPGARNLSSALFGLGATPAVSPLRGERESALMDGAEAALSDFVARHELAGSPARLCIPACLEFPRAGSLLIAAEDAAALPLTTARRPGVLECRRRS